MGRRRGRYLAVLRGSDEVARNQLLEYFRGNRDVQYSERQGNRDPMREIWVRPFNLGTPAEFALRQEVNAERISSFQPFVNNFAFLTAPGVDQRLIVNGLLADRASITIARSRTGTRQRSQLTGRNYTSYGGQSIVIPFGRSGTIQTGGAQEVFQVIFGRVKAANSSNLASYIPANFGVS